MDPVKRGRGRPTHKPNEQIRKQVEALAGFGLPIDQIGHVVDLHRDTIRKYYADAIESGSAKANAKIAKTLFEKAVSGDTASLIFWAKTRMRWRETRDDDEHPPTTTVNVSVGDLTSIVKDALKEY